MAKEIQIAYDELRSIRKYLIKIGPEGRKDKNICDKKLKLSNAVV